MRFVFFTGITQISIVEDTMQAPIIFEDSAVKEVVANRFGTDGEITFKQAAQVTNEQLEGLFNSNTTITKFNEFVFFTGITKISIVEDTNTSKTTAPFRGCSNLEEITLPYTLKEIGYRAFDQCVKLRKMKNIDKVRIFDFCGMQGAGRSATNVEQEVITVGTIKGGQCLSTSIIPKEVIFEEGITLIPDRGAMLTADIKGKWKHITIPSTVTAIGGNAFQYQELDSLILPDGITSIGESAFIRTKGIYNFQLTNKITSIGQYAFKWSDLSGIVQYPENNTITSIPYECFCACYNITGVVIPKNITNIAQYAFEGCNKLEEVYVKSTIPPTLHADAFKDTNNYFKIYVPLESVEAYKTASVWSNYADRIFWN